MARRYGDRLKTVAQLRVRWRQVSTPLGMRLTGQTIL